MGVYEASLPRLTAQGLLWSARHPPADNNSPRLTSDYLPLAPAERQKRKVAMQDRPVYDVHGLVCVALWLGFHHIQGFSRGAVRKSSLQRGYVARRSPVYHHRCTCRVCGGNQPGSGPPCSGCEGPGYSAGGEMQWKAVFSGRKRRDSTTQSSGGPQRLRHATRLQHAHWDNEQHCFTAANIQINYWSRRSNTTE